MTDSANPIGVARAGGLTPGLALSLVLALLAGALAGAGSALAISNLAADGSRSGSAVAEAPADTTTTVADEAGSTAVTVSTVVAEVADAVVTLEVQGRGLFPAQAMSGSGSGFFVSDDGLIVTAYHVIEDATAITVVLANGMETSATVVAADPDNDVAILDAAGSGYAIAPLATHVSSVGETVIAIGNALGEYQTTVTTGVVSGIDRSAEVAVGRSTIALDGLIQTDAALVSGMSGGPILNMAGEVIGIATADVADADGIAFAEPVDAAADLLASLPDGSA